MLLKGSRRAVLVGALALALFGIHLIPRPQAARADICSVPVVSTACSVVSTIVDVGGHAAKLGINVGSGVVSIGGKVVGKVVSIGGNIVCNWVAEGWMKKIGCGPIKSILQKLAPGMFGKLAGGGSGTTGSSSTAQAALPLDSPQSYLRTSAIATGAALASAEIAHVIGRGTSADVSASWFQSIYGRVAGFAVGVAALAFLLALLEGASTGDGALVAQAVRAIPYAAIMTGAAISLVMLGVQLVDRAGELIAGPSMHDVTRVLHVAAVLFAGLGLIAKGASAAASKHAAGGVVAKLGGIAKLAAFPAAMFAICGAIAAGAVAVELLLREVAIYAAVVLVPLVLAARIWPRLRHGGERLGRLLAAVIVSKLALVVILATMAELILRGGVNGLVAGTFGLFMVALAPGMFYGLFAMAEHGFTRQGMAVAPQPTSAAQRMADVVGWHTARVSEIRGEPSGVTVSEPPPRPTPPSPAARPEPAASPSPASSVNESEAGADE